MFPFKCYLFLILFFSQSQMVDLIFDGFLYLFKISPETVSSSLFWKIWLRKKEER